MRRLSENEKKSIVKLAKDGMSLSRISKKLGISKTTLYYHIKAFTRKMKKPEVERLSDWEKGYVVGLFIGDGNLYFGEKNYSYRVVFNFNKSENGIVQTLTDILRKCGAMPNVITYRNMRRVVCVSKVLYNYMKDFTLYKKSPKGGILINKKIGIKNFLPWDLDLKFGFIAGMLDSDGYVGPDRNSIRALITSSSRILANQIYEILGNLNLTSFLQFNTSKNSWTIRLSTPAFRNYKDKINCIKGPSSNGRTLPSQ